MAAILATCSHCAEQYDAGLTEGRRESEGRIRYMGDSLIATRLENARLIAEAQKRKKWPEWVVVGNILALIIAALTWVLR
jgi:hypothetical protein